MPLRADLLTPIPGENPSGSNYRYHPDTDKLKEARREDADVPQGAWKTTLKTADYAAVIKLASDIVSNRSKDLQIAVWLVDAHIRREGWPVVGPAFRFLQDFLSQFWDTLYPELEDGEAEIRAAPLDWLGTKLEQPLRSLPLVKGGFSWIAYQESRRIGYEADTGGDYLKQQAREASIAEGKITAEQFDEALDETPVTSLEKISDQINDGLEALEQLGDFCDPHFGEFAPSFIKIRGALEDVSQTLTILINRKGPSRRPDPVDDTSAEMTVDEDQFAAVIASSDDTPIPAPDDLTDSPFGSLPDEESSDGDSGSLDLSSIPSFSGDDDVAAHLAAICKYLRDKDPSEVPAYTVIRGYRFGELRSNAPPVIYSMLEPPASDIRLALKSNLNNCDWPAVLDASEAAAALPCGRGWLDLHRYTVTALHARGFESAANAVKSLVRGLVQDLPDLLEMSFLDDTPVANAETKAWIANLLSPPPVEEPAAESSSDSSSSDYSIDTSDSTDYSLSLGDTPVDTDSLSLGDSSTDLTTALASSEPTAEAVPDFSTLAISLEPVPDMVVMDPEPEPEPEPDVFEAALASARDGQLSESVGMLVKSQAKERSNRARFKRKTQIAHVLVAGEKQAIARPLLEEIVEEITTRRLEDWEEAQVLAYPVELLMRCLGQSDPTKKTELYERLCKLDPLRALNAFSDHA